MKKLLLTVLFICLFSCPVLAAGEFDLIYPFDGGYARVVSELKWGLLDENLEQVVPMEWDFIGELSENRRIVKRGNLYGFINEYHQTEVSPVYTQVGNFSGGLACVKNSDGKWGYIDPFGQVIISFQFDDANDFSCGRALVKTDGLYGYIDPQGVLVIPAKFTEAYSFFEDRACVREEELYGYLNPGGEMVIPAAYELAFDFCEGGAVVKSGGYGLINTDGGWLIQPTWKKLSPALSGGYLKGEKDGKNVFVDTNGAVRSSGYSDLGMFSESFAPVKIGDEYGYLDTKFQMVIPGSWDSVGRFSGGYAPVSRDGLFGYIDQTGTPVTEIIYAEATTASSGYGLVQEAEGKWSFLKLSPAVSVVETSEEACLLLQVGNKIMKKGEEEIVLDTSPILYEGVTMLPIRQVVEAIGGTVNWDPEEEEISLRYHHTAVTMNLGQTGAFVNGRVEVLSVAPMIQNGRTLIPLRFAVESLGCTVKWVPEMQEIFISYEPEA